MAFCVKLISCSLLVLLSRAVHVRSRPAQGNIEYSISEELPAGFVVGNIVASAALETDFSREILRTFQYRVLDGNYAEYFTVDKVSWRRADLKTTSHRVDRDAMCPQQTECVISVNVAIHEPPQYFDVFTLDIIIEDINDNSPRFPSPTLNITVSENASPGVQFVVPSAYDPDSGHNGVQRYEFYSVSDKFNLGVINNTDGTVDLRLKLARSLDREDVSSYFMKVTAYDGDDNSGRNTGKLDIHVFVDDANDNSPVFTRSLYEVSLDENADVDSPVVQVHALDDDEGLNGDIVYSFSPQTELLLGDVFSINSDSGEISLSVPLDFETQSSYNLVVTARDKGPSSVPANAKVVITVLNVNDHAPRIVVNGSPNVRENMAAGTFAAFVTVDDDDDGPSGEVSCSVDGQDFGVETLRNRNMFKIVTRSSLDRETRDLYYVTLVCQDQGQPALRATQIISIKILDENDNAPVFVEENYVKNLRENNAERITLVRVNATDSDLGRNAEVTYSLHFDAMDLVTIDPITGIISTNHVFDHENMTQFVFHAVAHDNGNTSLSSMTAVIVNILDVNDEAPSFTWPSYDFGTYENQEVGAEIGKVSAEDPDDPPFDTFTYEFDRSTAERNIFRINSTTGQITTSRILNREHQSAHYLVVIARDLTFPYPSSSTSVTVYVADTNDNAPQFVFPKLGNNMIEVSSYAHKGYVFSKVTATDDDLGNNARVDYSVGKGNHDGYFDVDPDTGVLSCAVDFDIVTRDVHNLTIVASDGGHPPKSAYALLTVVINRTVEFAQAHSLPRKGEKDGLGFHQRIILILGCVTAVLVAILLTAIICIRRKQIRHERESYKYTCRVDMAQRMSTAPDDGVMETVTDDLKDPPPDISGLPPTYGSLGYEDNNPDLVRMHGYGSGDSTQPRGQSPGVYDTGYRYDGRMAGTVRSDVYYPTGSAPWPGRSPQVSPQHAADQTQVQGEVDKLLEILKTNPLDSDSTSGCSADMSNSDSGRFHTEEGCDMHPIAPPRTSVSGVQTPPFPLNLPPTDPASHQIPYNNLSHPADATSSVPMVTKTNITFGKSECEDLNKGFLEGNYNTSPHPACATSRQKPVPPQRKQGASLNRKQAGHVTFNDNFLQVNPPELGTFKSSSLSPRHPRSHNV